MTKMICHITDEDHLFPDPTPEDDRIQEQGDDERNAQIESMVEEMQQDADRINDAFQEDNELDFDIASIIADFNDLNHAGMPATETIDIVNAWSLINAKLTAALRAMAVTEIDGE